MPTTVTITCGGTARQKIRLRIPDRAIGSYSYTLNPPIQLSGGAACTLEQGGANPSSDAFVALSELKGTLLPSLRLPSPPPPPSPRP